MGCIKYLGIIIFAVICGIAGYEAGKMKKYADIDLRKIR